VRPKQGCMRSLAAIFLALLAPAATRADSELPDAYTVNLAGAPKAVETLVERACPKDGMAAERSRWLTYRIPLRPPGSAYFVQCVFPASNDIHIVILEDATGQARFATFGHDIHVVYNARWDERNQIITDISGSGAGCAHERRWKWNGRNFVLISQRILGCKQQD
jgi:hypothetical protein